MKELLNKLTHTFGPSGYEKQVRELILHQIQEQEVARVMNRRKKYASISSIIGFGTMDCGAGLQELKPRYLKVIRGRVRGLMVRKPRMDRLIVTGWCRRRMSERP